MLLDFADHGDGDAQLPSGSRVSAHHRQAVCVARTSNAGVKRLHHFDGHAMRNGDADYGKAGTSIHCGDVANVHGYRLEAEVAHRHDRALEVHSLNQSVHCNDLIKALTFLQHRGVVADTADDLIVRGLPKDRMQAIDQTELTHAFNRRKVFAGRLHCRVVIIRSRP